MRRTVDTALTARPIGVPMMNWTKVQLQIFEVQSTLGVGKSGRFGNRIDFAHATDVIESENQASFARSELGVEFGSERIASGLRR